MIYIKNKIYTINDWWGGPLCGVAEYMGDKYIYQRRFDDEADMYSNDYFLTPVDDETFNKVMENWDRWISLFNSGRADDYVRTDDNNIDKIALEQSLYQYCVKRGQFFINDNFNSYLENSWVEWSDSDYNFPETFVSVMSDLYNRYYEDFTWMILSADNQYFINLLNKEIRPGHDLYGKKLYPAAKSEANDDVIFSDLENEESFYLIHFTYSDNIDTCYPHYRRIGNLAQLREFLLAGIDRQYL